MTETVARHHVWRGLPIALAFLVSLALLPLGTGVTELSWLSLIVVQQVVARHFRSDDLR